MSTGHTVSSYLIEQLYQRGVRHVFGVPGDYVLAFYHDLEKSSLQVVNTCDEQGAGFAADAYARMNGLGVVCVTYCVGGLKVANTTAQAYAEKSPVVVISGAPGLSERIKTPLLHHVVRDFDTQLKVFEQFTVASTAIEDPQTACREIDRVLDAALRYKRPVYIELPRDMTSVPVTAAGKLPKAMPSSDGAALQEALQEAAALINAAQKPVILAGVELHRFGLQDVLLDLAEQTGIPVASTLLSKSVIRENHPQYLGVYQGAMSRKAVREYFESSDCTLLLGTFLTDVNLGIFTANIEQGRSICATSEAVSIHYHSYIGINLEDFMRGLLKADIRRREGVQLPAPPPLPRYKPAARPVTVKYLFQRLNDFIDDSTVVIADPGDAAFGAVDMTIHGETEFLAPAYYNSLGYAVPASLGVQTAKPQLRPLVLVGDGAFQMTGMELSTIARFGCTPIVIVLNNRGYSTERPMLDGGFNDVHLWRFSRIPEVLDAGRGFEVGTENELEAALEEARKHTESFCIIDVHIDPQDRSQALQRLTDALKDRVRAKAEE